MSETIETLPVEGDAPAPEPTAQPAETPPDTGTEETPDQQPETQPDPAEEDRTKAQKRIDRLTAEKWAARRQAAALEARLQEIERQTAQRDPNAPLTPADIDRLATQRAAEMRQAEAFNAQCDEAFDAGTKAFPDFEATLGNFRAVGGLPPVLIEAALETDAPHTVLHYLGKHLDEAEDVLKLSPARMGAAVARIAVKASAPPPPPPVSKAPPPIRPVQTASTTSADSEPKDIDQWMEWRNKQARG